MTHRFKTLSGVGSAIYTYTGSDGPLTSPTSHLPELLFHDSFDYYAAASGFPVDVTINHGAVTADAGTAQGNVTSYDSITETDTALATHGLGYKPNFMVAILGVQYPAGCPIQVGAFGARRSVNFWVDTTKIWVRDSARPSIPGLPAISVIYHVTVFRDPASVAGAPRLFLSPTRVRFGFGRIDSNERSMREPDTGETVYAIPSGGTMSLHNGRARYALPDGSVFDIGPILGPNSYDSNFFGGPSKKVAI